MKVKITSDSTCDLSPALIEKYAVDILPLSVTMGDKSYKDGVDMDTDDIFAFVDTTGTLPHTSAVNIGEYTDVFQRWIGEGYELVHFSLSSEMSSAYRNACIAAEETGHVRVVDAKNLSTGQGLLVVHAAELAAKGASPDAIFEECTALAGKVEASFVIDRLDYLYKGGRCSALSALGANLMKLKPCIEVKDGKMSPGKKYRGSFEKVIAQYVRERLEGRTDIDTSRIFVTHSKCPDGLGQKVAALVREIVPDAGEILETDAGATITTHCGPNTLGVLFIRK